VPSAATTLRLALLLTLAIAPSLRAQRMVFAHYMLANRDYAPNDPTGEGDIAAYQREIRQAQAMGIDGFALNAGGWFKEPRYIRRASEMFEAALRLHSGFQLFFSADMCCFNEAVDVEDMMRRFAGNPRYAAVYFRYRGKALLTTFAGSNRGPQFWRAVRNDLEHGANLSQREAPCDGNLCPLAAARSAPSSNPLPIVFVPSFFFGGELPGSADISAGIAAYRDSLDGAFYWGIAGVPGLGRTPDQRPSSEAYASALHAAGKLYMAPICPQFYGANAGRYYEYSGFGGMRAMWMNAINTTHPEWIEIITWNDFVEGSYISPIDAPIYDKDPAAPDVFHRRNTTDLIAFFIAWYKTGHQPAITHNAIYWAYRTQTIDPSALASTKLYGPFANTVYVTANLPKPATLRVSFGKQVITKELPAGSTDVQIPVTPGFAPTFELWRGTIKLSAGQGDEIISPDKHDRDLYYAAGAMHD
jgi:hypothetical protein